MNIIGCGKCQSKDGEASTESVVLEFSMCFIDYPVEKQAESFGITCLSTISIEKLAIRLPKVALCSIQSELPSFGITCYIWSLFIYVFWYMHQLSF